VSDNENPRLSPEQLLTIRRQAIELMAEIRQYLADEPDPLDAFAVIDRYVDELITDEELEIRLWCVKLIVGVERYLEGF
jgi:hypothetical protein